MNIIVISPHRDDAAFSLSLAIDAWLAQGHDVRVLSCFTRSKYAPFWVPDPEAHSNQIDATSALRADEDRAWAGTFSHNIRMMDLKLNDAPLRLNCADSEVCTFPTDDSDPSKQVIKAAITDLNADAVVLPMGLGGHVDHLTARDAAIKATLEADVPMAAYEDLPYAARPSAAKGILSSAASLRLGLTAGFVHMPGDIAGSVKRKLELALLYRSQIDYSVARNIADFSLRYKGRERLWMSPKWRESGLTSIELKEQTNQDDYM